MTAPAWRWIKESSVLAIHEEQIAEHGGLAGTRDLALLQSALARPKNLEAYGDPDVADHPFLDGNKRTAWVVGETFLLKNGYELTAGDREGVTAMLSVADGTMSEPEFAVWLRTYMRPVKS
jgi:death on curing protein